MSAIEDRERVVLLDLSRAASSADAVRQLEASMGTLNVRPGNPIDLNTGDLMLSSGVLSKMQMILRKIGVHIETLYSSVPQTQQSALDEGLLVRSKPAERKRFNPEAFVAQAYKDLDLPFEDLSRKAPGNGDAKAQVVLPEISPRVAPQAAPVEPPTQTVPLFESDPVTLPEQPTAIAPQPEAVATPTVDLPITTMAPPAPAPVSVSHTIAPAPQAAVSTKPVAAPAQPLSQLSITHDDGSLEIIQTQPTGKTQTVYYRANLRSGQILESTGNIVVVGDAHSGSEILADGDILIWGFLGGIAHAGRSGNEDAEIRAMRIEAVQLRIGNHIARRPDRLFKGQQEATKGRGPEVARIRDGEIKIYEDSIER